MRAVILTLLLILFCLPSLCQKEKTVQAEYTYHAPENISPVEAKRIALERAKIEAMSEAFNTIVQQTNTTRIESRDGKSNVNMISIGGSEVKGEWIETIGEPTYDIDYIDGMLVVTAKVKGKAREIVSANIDFKARVLCNGTEDKFETDQFKSGDDFYLSFNSPVAGYLAVYFVDADNKVYCMLPYGSQQDGSYPIRANRRYLFFSEKDAPQQERPIVVEYNMTCERSSVADNQVYIVFSPNKFTKATDYNAENQLMRELDYEEFHKWLVNCRTHDKDMNSRRVPITVSKK